jgi:hypothetical protein
MELTAPGEFCTARFIDATSINPCVAVSIHQCPVACCGNFAVPCLAGDSVILSFSRLGEFLKGHLAISPGVGKNGVGWNFIAVVQLQRQCRCVYEPHGRPVLRTVGKGQT